MYNEYFGFKEAPFSIAPDPHYLYMTAQHREALAHLVYGLNSEGGCILLTGEVGTGKTTICRCLLEQIPEHANIALLLNPKVTAVELLETICDEFKIPCFEKHGTIKTYIDQINTFLLEANARNEKTVLIIDEAQNLDSSVLEQLRLLTNLETDQRKLLQIVMLGQPELLDILSRPEMRQLAQRITARFHLRPLSREELKAYISHRLAVAGQNIQLFSDPVIKRIHQISQGIPRLINVICDRALLGSYVQDDSSVELATVNKAAKEIFGEIKNQPHQHKRDKTGKLYRYALVASLAVALLAIIFQFSQQGELDGDVRLLANTTAAEPGRAVNETVPAAKPIQVSIVRADEPIHQDTETAAAEPDNTATSGDTIRQLIADNRDNKADAYQFLFSIWNRQYDVDSNGSACSHATRVGLSCLHRSGNLHSLRRLNRPAVIKIFNTSGDESYVTITALDHETARLHTGKEELSIDIAVLDTHWFGDYTLLWQKPPYYEQAIRPGNQGPIVQWLDQQLVRLYGQDEEATISDTYSEKLMSQIKDFQQSKGLHPDGIAGPRTLIHLNNELGLNAPQLYTTNKTRES